VAFAEQAVRRFDLDRAAGASGRPPGGDVTDAGSWVEFFTWEEAERWLWEGLPYSRRRSRVYARTLIRGEHAARPFAVCDE
jgi:hypothetical protein